jgi:hypothetical protein
MGSTPERKDGTGSRMRWTELIGSWVNSGCPEMKWVKGGNAIEIKDVAMVSSSPFPNVRFGHILMVISTRMVSSCRLQCVARAE